MINPPLRAACQRFTEEVCGHAIICGCGSFLALWLIASVTLPPVGIGLYVGYDRHIGTILMSVGGVCLFITIVYAMAVKFLEYYHEEVAKEAQLARAAAPVAVAPAVQVAVAAVPVPVPATPPVPPPQVIASTVVA